MSWSATISYDCQVLEGRYRYTVLQWTIADSAVRGFKVIALWAVMTETNESHRQHVHVCTRDPLRVFLQATIISYSEWPPIFATRRRIASCTVRSRKLPFYPMHCTNRMLISVKRVHIVERIIKKYISVLITMTIVIMLKYS